MGDGDGSKTLHQYTAWQATWQDLLQTTLPVAQCTLGAASQVNITVVGFLLTEMRSISILLSTMFWTKNHWTVQNTLNGANPLGVTGDWVKEESRFLNPLSFFTSFLILWSDWALVFKVCCCQSVRLLHCGSFSKVLPDMYCFVSLPSPFYISSLRR